MVFIQAVVGKKKILVQFKDGQRRELIASSLLYLFLKEEVGQDVNENISGPPEIGQG